MELWEAIHWHLSSLFEAWMVFCKPAAYQSEKLSQVVLDDGLARLVEFTFHLIVDDPLTINRLHRCNPYSPVLRWSVSYSLHLSTFETPSPKSTQREEGTTLFKGTMLKRNLQEEQSMLELLTKEVRSIDPNRGQISARDCLYNLFIFFCATFQGEQVNDIFEGSSVISKIFTVSFPLISMTCTTCIDIQR